MLIASVVIGLLTAYYFGLRAGGIAAAVAGALFLGALIMPGKALIIYGLVVVGVSGVLFAGPRYGRPAAKTNVLRLGRGLIGRLFKLLRKLR